MSFSVPKFNPELLVGGYTDSAQLQNWFMGKGNSIYVKWVPDELTEQDATHYFSILGLIKRVEFVPHKTGNSRMLFVHFEEWHNNNFSVEIRQLIANAYPAEHSMPITYKLVTGIPKTYNLKCCVNVRPIPTVEYNTHQLSDMFERLNDRVTGEMKEMREEMQLLKYEVARLNAIVDAYEENANYSVIYPEDLTSEQTELDEVDSELKDKIE